MLCGSHVCHADFACGYSTGCGFLCEILYRGGRCFRTSHAASACSDPEQHDWLVLLSAYDPDHADAGAVRSRNPCRTDGSHAGQCRTDHGSGLRYHPAWRLPQHAGPARPVPGCCAASACGTDKPALTGQGIGRHLLIESCMSSGHAAFFMGACLQGGLSQDA